MMTFALPYPMIDPVIFSVGPIQIKWYGLAYVAGILIGWWLGLRLLRKYPNGLDSKSFDDGIVWMIVGIVVGGRLGHFVLYSPETFVTTPLDILKTWQGGMSFHGGLVGVIIAALLYCKKSNINFFKFTDIISTVVPLGLGLGRLANFINGELFGRITDVSWGMVFPYGGPLPRHPSQLYEAFLEGFVLFVIMLAGWKYTSLRNRPGRLSGIFLIGYSVFRIFSEIFREPSDGMIFNNMTAGQFLCIPFIGLGWFLLRRPVKDNDHTPPSKTC